MALLIEYFSAAGNAVNAGVFIPISALPGILNGGELATGQAARESKILLSICNAIFVTLNPSNFDKLGFAVSKGQPTGAGTDIINQNYSFTNTFMVDHAANTLLQIPFPTSGSFINVGKFTILEVFPGSVAVAAGGAVSGPGIVIPELDDYGGPSQAIVTNFIADPDGDFRIWFAALFQMILNESTVRTGTDASAVIVKSRSNAAGVTPTPAFTDVVNPTTAILATDLVRRSFFSITYSMTLQLELNQTTQTFDVRNVVA